MRSSSDALPTLKQFPVSTFDKLRYGDTDRQGHVNNAVFSTFLESGRVDLLHNPENPLHADDTAFVIANVNLNFIAEINWPGQVHIGTGVLKVGNSSIHLRQAVFQNGRCVATADTVLVQMNEHTRKSQPLSETVKAILESYRL